MAVHTSVVLVTGTKIAPQALSRADVDSASGRVATAGTCPSVEFKTVIVWCGSESHEARGNALTQSLLRELPVMLGTLPQLILRSDDPMCPIPETLTRVRLPLLVLQNSAPICMLPNTFRLQALVLPQLAASPVQPENWNFAAGIAVRFMVDPFWKCCTTSSLDMQCYCGLLLTLAEATDSNRNRHAI